MAHETLAPGVRRREVWAWAMYDFANSGYTTVVITAVFNAYFVAEVAGNQPWATLAWTLALALSYAAIMVTAPLLGAYADARAAKKRVLLATTVGCVLGTAALTWVRPGDLWLGIALIALSNYCFGSGENIVAAFLPEIAQGDSLGRVSGWGWALGYIGGLIALAVCLAYVTQAQQAGLPASQFVPVTMLITAALFALASAPTFILLRERARPTAADTHYIAAALNQLRDTWRSARHYRDLHRFLWCLLFYQAGIQTVVALAAVYAQQVMGFTTRDTLLLILVVNISAALGAFAFGHVQDRIGHQRTIVLTLAAWILAIFLAWSAQGLASFWVAANVIGLCLGSSQSAGRALVGYLSPPAQTAQFFGLWGLAVKASSILGPVTYGLVTWLSGANHRLAMLITGLFFVAGLVIVASLDVRRGRAAALAASGSA